MLVGADGVAAADDLIQHLHSPTLRCDALNRLRQLPSSALTNVSGIAPALAPCLTDPNATVILHALQLIANLAPVLAPLSLPKLAPHLIDALAHPKSVVSDRTLRTLSVLAETSPDIVVDALDVCGFRNCDANVRCEALSAFAFLFTRNVLKSTALFPEIRRLADNDTDAHVRQTALASLNTVHNHVAGPLTSNAQHRDGNVPESLPGAATRAPGLATATRRSSQTARPIHSALPKANMTSPTADERNPNDAAVSLPDRDDVKEEPTSASTLLQPNDPMHIASKLRALKAKGRRAFSAQVQRSPSQEAFSVDVGITTNPLPASAGPILGNAVHTLMQTTPAGECWKAPSRRQPRRSTGMGRRMEGVLCRDRYTETSEVMAMVSHDIDAECARVVADLQSTAWETKFTALGTLRRLAVHHHDQLHPYITSTMTGAILSSIASLRSSLARNALLAMTDLVSCCGSSFDRPALLSIIPELLRRATDSNEFLAVEAQKALDAIASLKHSTQALLDVRGRTQGEKAHIAACLLRCVNRRGCPSGSTPRLLKLACAFLEEGASDVRQVAKSLVCAIASRLTPAALCDTAAVVLTARQADLVRNVLAKASPSATHSKPQWDLTPQRVGTWTSYGEEQGGEQPVAIVLGPTVDANLASSEWRRRLQGLDGVLLAIRSVSLLTSGDVLLLTDRIGPRLSDANSKVTMCALDAFNCMVEGLPGPMSAAALTETLPSLCACMASSHANVRNLASSVVDTLMHRSHGPELLAQLARLASFGNIRVKAAAVAKLAVLVDLVVNKAAVRKHALPLAIALLDERKGDVYRANRQLLHALEACLDKQVWADEILALSADKAKKLHEMFVSSVP